MGRLIERSRSTFLIWGAGGHGKVVADLVRACGHRLAGFVDADSARLGTLVEPGGGRILLDQEALLRHRTRDTGHLGDSDAIALAIGNNAVRHRLLALLDRWCVPPLVHPTAVVSRSTVLGRGTVILPLAVINACAQIGDAVIINSAAVVEHECVIGDGVHVSPQATLAGGVRVGDRSWIGAGATAIQGVAIGVDAVVAAGAVVIRDVPDGISVAGVPAAPI